jgi:hypothetical protein
MSTVAESPPLTAESLSGYRKAGRAWAVRQGLPAMTPVTFRGVPWNAPYYERLGFRELTASEVTPGLTARRAADRGADGDICARVCMRRDLIADGPPGRDANP